jgi:rhamnosyltransferase
MKITVVAAVIVTYEAELAALAKLLNVLTNQVNCIYVVDNGSSNQQAVAAIVKPSNKNVWIPLKTNIGLAAAQNIAIRIMLTSSASHVALFDQDSLPAGDMIAALLNAEAEIAKHQSKIAALGPCYFDERQQNPPPFIAVKGLSLKRFTCESPSLVHPVDYLIASGSLISREAIVAVGLMREDFFIDYIDIEWGLRAKSIGYQSYGICAAKMAHSLGESPINFLGKKIPLHSPLRHYYHFRNAVLLYRSDVAPLNWKIVDGYKLLLKFVFYSLFARPRTKQCWSMIRGAVHGVFNKLP